LQALQKTKPIENKTMRTHKSDSVNQYSHGFITVAVTRQAWRKKFEITKGNVTLFILGAYGEIPRKFAAETIRQFRNDFKRNGGGK
jgi:hypothetical protein